MDIQKYRKRIEEIISEQLKLCSGKSFEDLNTTDKFIYSRMNKEIANLSFQCFESLKTDPKQQKEATQFFIKAFDLCHPKAKKLLNKSLSNTLKLQINDKCENSDNPDKLYEKAIANLLGIGVKMNLKRGIQLIQQSANKNQAQAMSLLATMHKWGQGVPYDDKLASQLHEKAAQLGNHRSQFLKGMLKEAAKHGYADALYEYGEKLLTSIKKLDKTIEKTLAFRLLKLAAEQGQTNAGVLVGKIYDRILNNPRRALEYFRLSAERGSKEAKLRIGLEVDAKEEPLTIFEKYHYSMVTNDLMKAAQLLMDNSELKDEWAWDIQRSDYDMSLREKINKIGAIFDLLKIIKPSQAGLFSKTSPETSTNKLSNEESESLSMSR